MRLATDPLGSLGHRLLRREAGRGEGIELATGIISSMRTARLLFLIPCLVLTVCGGTAEPTPTPPPTQAPADTPEPAESPAPRITPLTQDGATPVAAKSGRVIDQGEFLRVIAPLDEARGYCLDIPGHMAGVRLQSTLQVHTCKHGIWNHDGRFDVRALGPGVIRMPHYELCLQAENTSIGARLLLAECSEVELQTWTQRDSGEIALAAVPQMCITIEEGPGRDAGGPQYLMKGVGLDTCASQASDRQRWTTVIPR